MTRMRIVAALIFGLLVISGAAEAASYTVSTTAAMDAVLGHVLTRINVERLARGETALTADQLFQQIVRTALGQYRGEFDAATRAQACAAFTALSPTDHTSILTQLGGKSPCP